MPDVTPDWKRETEGGIGRKKPPRGWRSKGRKMATREEWQALRVEKLSGWCRLCGASAVFERLELHHLVSRGIGGDDVAGNLVAICRDCHAAVTTRSPAALQALASSLTDAEYAYIVGKLGEGGIARLFNA